MSSTINSIRREGVTAGRRSLFFPLMATVMALTAFVGFSRSFYFRGLLGAEYNGSSEPLPSWVIVHGVVYTIWIFIFLVQSWLIQGRRVSMHKSLGLIGIVVAVGVAVMGVVTALNFVPRHAATGSSLPDITGNLVTNLANMAIFALFVSLAVHWRRRPANHKRMMYLATVFLMGPALSDQRPVGEFMVQLIPQPIAVGGVLLLAALLWHDILTTRRILPVTLIGVASYALLWTIFLTVGEVDALQNWTATFL